MPSLPTASGAIFYAQRGRRGPALVCIHGAGGTHASWGYQLRDLSDSARVYALDLPGHGRSALPGRASIAEYGAALLQFLDACGLERATLLGHSMGGAIALWVALDQPGRVSGLGLVGTGARLRVAASILDGFAQDRQATIRQLVASSYAPNAPATLRAQAEAEYMRCDPAVHHGDFVACDGFDVTARLGEIRCPTVVVCGTADHMTPPRYSQALCDGIPSATFTLVPGAGHMVLIEQPQAVSAALQGGD